MRTWIRTRRGTAAFLVAAAAALCGAVVLLNVPVTSVELSLEPWEVAAPGLDPAAVGQSCGSLLHVEGLPRPADCTGPLDSRAAQTIGLLLLALVLAAVPAVARARRPVLAAVLIAWPASYVVLATWVGLVTHSYAVVTTAQNGYLSGLELTGSFLVAMPLAIPVAAVTAQDDTTFALWATALVQAGVIAAACGGIYAGWRRPEPPEPAPPTAVLARSTP